MDDVIDGAIVDDEDKSKDTGITLTQEEIKLLAIVLSQITLKLVDAAVLAPLFNRLKEKVPPEPEPAPMEVANNA